MHPILYEINTRVWRKRFGPATTLLEVPDAYWQQLGALGVDYVWLMGVWQTGPNVLDYALEDGLQQAYSRALPDWTNEDVIGSPYAIDRYVLHPSLGKSGDLKKLKIKLNGYGLKLMLDFVPNHFHAESSWIAKHPDVFLEVGEDQLAHDQETYYRPPSTEGKVFAHGKDPYFAAWQDTVQVNYAAPAARAFMQEQLLEVAEVCDAVRCDMAMLMLADVFRQTWGHVLYDQVEMLHDFWPTAIRNVKEKVPGFCFLAEVYWDREWTLQQQGFDFTYDKRLRDRLLEGNLGSVRSHLYADTDFQTKSARFLENHDEDRILSEMAPAKVKAAALATYTLPGLSLFYEGQWEGRRKRLPVQLGRQPEEFDPAVYGISTAGLMLGQLPGLAPVDPQQVAFYDYLLQLLKQPALRNGRWELLNSSDHLLTWQWNTVEQQIQIRINYSPVSTEIHLSPPGEGSWQHFLGPPVAYNTLMLGPYQWLVLEKIGLIL
ncbi:MAG: alpha-amylase family glycosyl hydrolase [Lewinella sp.]|uniref:alpha-amylase family glycosyl hydrolase n=1 Tax=Lewinella sp. TaxID=2004506 RepID=UPI003D6C4EE7